MFLILVKMTPDLLKVAEFKVIRSWTVTDIWFSVSLHLSLTLPPLSCSELDLFENRGIIFGLLILSFSMLGQSRW